jgi:hypothetical protein
MTPSFCIGPYALGQAINDFPDIIELTWWERGWPFWRRASADQTTHKSRKTISFIFPSVEWNVSFSVVEGTIRVIRARYSCKSKATIDAIIAECALYFLKSHGALPQNQNDKSLIWRTPFCLISLKGQSAITGPNNQGIHAVSLEAKTLLPVPQMAGGANN